MSDVLTNRLTDEDRAAMRARVVGKMAEWDVGARQHRGAGAVYVVSGTDAETLDRLAWHAIGCDSRDLRDSELDETRAMVRSVVDAHNA